MSVANAAPVAPQTWDEIVVQVLKKNQVRLIT